MKWLLILTLMLNVQLAYAEIETIPLRHRLAEDLLPQVQAISPESTVIRAYGDKLIIKADRATIANIQALLKQIDIAQQSVIISVLRTTKQLNNNEVSHNQVDLTLGSQNQADIEVKRWSTKDNKNRDQKYRVRGVAGYPATISMGRDVPQQDYLVFSGQQGVAIGQNTRYISADSGFKALPELLPDQQVRVEIYPFFANIKTGDGSIDRSQLISTVVGPIGKWLEIGLITDQKKQQSTGTSSYSSYSSRQQYLYLKIETNSK